MFCKPALSGFSLLELMVALAVGSIILVVGVPSFQGTLNNQRMTSATNELVMSLNLAKSEAIKRVMYVSVCKSSNGVSCTAGGTGWDDGWIVFANAAVANLGSIDAGDEIIRVYPGLRSELTVTSIGTIADFVSFRPTGTIGTSTANMTGTLTACDERGSDYARGILLEPSGRWRVSHDQTHAGAALTC
jgi:type IV fimbrial biogenesis protein FimT